MFYVKRLIHQWRAHVRIYGSCFKLLRLKWPYINTLHQKAHSPMTSGWWAEKWCLEQSSSRVSSRGGNRQQPRLGSSPVSGKVFSTSALQHFAERKSCPMQAQWNKKSWGIFNNDSSMTMTSLLSTFEQVWAGLIVEKYKDNTCGHSKFEHFIFVFLHS